MIEPTKDTDRALRLKNVPAQLAESIREAVASRDIEKLHTLVDGIAEHDAEVAEFVHSLLADYAFESLRELFDVQGR